MFDQFCDSEYLKKSQYKNADNLNARIYLHQRFSTNRNDWQDWVFEKADYSSRANHFGNWQWTGNILET